PGGRGCLAAPRADRAGLHPRPDAGALTMGVPQIIWIVLASVVLVTSYACDGLTNVISFKQRVFDVIAMTALVWWGGFFG
ncbi:lytic transglycosylase domain-containing protein, partial [Pseudomonas aeruginosa]|nr:lytic transglycosylase domain-containing protein [Pseudomonas aeruginosa]